MRPRFTKSGRTADGEIHLHETMDEPEAYIPDAPYTEARCPVCDFNYTAAGVPYVEDGNDNYEASWGGRGHLTAIPFEGECGHAWELCFGFHKGNTYIFARVVENVEDNRR